MKKILYGICSILWVATLSTVSASAHVTVKPGEVAPGQYQVFTVSVPNERDNPTVSVRVELPEAVPSATPTVAPGWTVDIDTSGSGDEQVTHAITWSGGTIPVDQRAEFSFSAKTPEAPGTLTWKAYQTYADGTVVSWDQTDSDEGHGTDATGGPASLTLVSAPTEDVADDDADTTGRYALYIAVAGFVVSLGALTIALRKR